MLGYTFKGHLRLNADVKMPCGKKNIILSQPSILEKGLLQTTYL